VRGHADSNPDDASPHSPAYAHANANRDSHSNQQCDSGPPDEYVHNCPRINSDRDCDRFSDANVDKYPDFSTDRDEHPQSDTGKYTNCVADEDAHPGPHIYTDAHRDSDEHVRSDTDIDQLTQCHRNPDQYSNANGDSQ